MASKYLICFDLHWWFYGDKIDGDMPISILQTTFQSHLSLSIIQLQLLNLEVLTKPSNTTPHYNQKYKIWAIEKQLLSYPPNFQKCWHLNSRSHHKYICRSISECFKVVHVRTMIWRSQFRLGRSLFASNTFCIHLVGWFRQGKSRVQNCAYLGKIRWQCEINDD